MSDCARRVDGAARARKPKRVIEKSILNEAHLSGKKMRGRTREIVCKECRKENDPWYWRGQISAFSMLWLGLPAIAKTWRETHWTAT